MALTDAQINKVALILGLSKRLINAQIVSLGAEFTAQDETDVIAELAKWTTAESTPFVKVHPMESNFGAETNVGNEKGDIARSIAILLQFEAPPAGYGSIGTLRIGL